MSDQKNALENDEHASKQNSQKTKRNKFFRKPSFHFFHTLLSKFKKGKRPASSDLSTSITSSMSTSATENYTDAINKSVSILSLYRKNEGNLPHINRTGVRSIKTISPNGYQAIVTKTNTIQTEIDQSCSVKTDLDMKIRLPRNVPPDSVMVSMHMDPITYVASTESFIEPDLKMSLSGRTLQLNCLKDSVSQTIFEGQVIFSSETDIKSIGNLPLIVSDNKREFYSHKMKQNASRNLTLKWPNI